MRKTRHKPEGIIAKLRQAEVLAAPCRPVAKALRSIGVTKVIYYRWGSGSGGLKRDQITLVKEREYI